MNTRRLVAIVVLVGAGVLAVIALVMRDTTTPIDSADVQARFTGEVGSAPGESGIYRYRTTGFETVDALQGARHDYPAETLMTIETGECGPVVRWHALEERWTAWLHCGPELAITTTIEYHQWFGIPDEEVEICPDPRPVFSASTGSLVCSDDDATETYLVDLVGVETVEVGGDEVEAVHIRRVSSLAGGSTGTTVADVWRLPDTALIVRMELRSESITASAAGDVTYIEEVTLELLDLLPGEG